MAYIQDISLLMRELLKVPKDYTPTAMEISKYIKSRYSNDKDIGKRPMGTRAYSSVPLSTARKMENAPPLTINAPAPKKPPRMVAKQRVAGRSHSFSTLRPNAVKLANKKNDTLLNKLGSDVKAAVKTAAQNRTYHQRKAVDAKKPKKPTTAPGTVDVQRSQRGNHRSFWSWQTAKNNIRQAVSEMVTTPAAKTKLSALADQHRLDPNLEAALERQRKELLSQMLDPGFNRGEPLRTREVIQKLLEDNKLEVQRREIAKLTELARSKVLQARRATYARDAKKRELDYA